MKCDNSNSLALLGQEIRQRRRMLGYSQEELAWRAELNRTYVTDVERGARNLSLSTIERLARALETPLSSLLRKLDAAQGLTNGGETFGSSQVDILLVEDNPHDEELTLRALRQARLANSIHVARDGVEALDYLFCSGSYSDRTMEDRLKLVLLDLNLPRMDGLEVLRRIRADERTREVPVVVLTFSEESSHIVEARRLGAEAYLVKPVDFQRLSKVTPQLNLSWSLQRELSKQTV